MLIDRTVLGVRIESERKESTSSLDAMKPSSSSEPINPNSPRQSPRSSFRGASMVLKAVDAFKQAAVHKETHEQKRAQMHPAKGRLHRSVKKVMLQNAVEKMRSLIGRPPSVDPEAGRSRPTSRNSAFGEIQRKPSHLELAKEDIETRKKSQSPL